MKITFSFYDKKGKKVTKTIEVNNKTDCIGVIFALDLREEVKKHETKIEREENESITDWLNRSSEIFGEVESLQNRYAPYGVILKEKVIYDFEHLQG